MEKGRNNRLIRPNDIQAPWIGHGPDYDQPTTEYDEDFAYETYRDMQLEEQYANESTEEES